MALVIRYKDDFRSLQEHITIKEGLSDKTAGSYKDYFIDSPLIFHSNYFKLKSLSFKLYTRDILPLSIIYKNEKKNRWYKG